MNKKQLIYIFLGAIAAGVVVWKSTFLVEKPVEKVESQINEEKTEKAIEKENVSSQTLPKSEAIDGKTEKSEEKAEQKIEKQPATINKKKEESADFTSELNKKTGKVVVKFKDGESIRDSEITDEMDKLPDQLSEKMSLKEIKSFLAIKAAFDHVVVSEAKKEGVDEEVEVKDEIEKRKDTVAGMMLLSEKAKKLMTDEALKAHYDKVWDESFKGTKEFSLKVISTSDKILAEHIAKAAVSEAKLNEIIESNKMKLKTMDLDKKPEASLPAEIISSVREKGKNAVVGPFPIRGVFMLFFVKDVKDAQKHDFSGKFKEEYEKIAMKDFIKQVNNEQYKVHNVKFYDVHGKEIDINKQTEDIKSSTKSKDVPDNQFEVGKLNDETVLARIGNEPVLAIEIRKFFKLKSLQDEALVMMAQQFNMKLNEVLVYATKLVVDDKLLAKEARESNYISTPEVKEKIKEIEKIEIARAYLKKYTNVSSEQIKKTYADFIKAIPEEDKNDHEISMKIVFFSTKGEADKALSSISSGQTKFNELFREKEAANKSAIDFKYVTRRTTDPELWSILKRASAGACYKDVIETEGARFGANGLNYAIIYVGDRRPITLPSLSNPADKKYFEAMAYQQVAAKFVASMLENAVVSIFDKTMQEITADRSYDKMLEAIVAGTR